MQNEYRPLKPFPPRGGIRIPHIKDTAGAVSLVMPVPKSVVIPMRMHIGAPCVPTVSVGDRVRIGDLIGDSDAYVSAPIHASVSGSVSAITDIELPNGSRTSAVEIISDGSGERADVAPPKVETREELLKSIRKSGLVGMGGAGFPASVKLTLPAGARVDTLIINAAECEPYITSDHREIIENSWDVLSGIYAVKELLGVHRVLIGIESNKPDAIKLLARMADDDIRDPENEVRVVELDTDYPQGAEKMLIRACTGRVVPAGGLPSDAGCVVMNVTSVAFLASYLKTGLPLVSKRVTVAGGAVGHPCNIIVPIGTRISDIIEYCGGYNERPSKLLLGGPMMGTALCGDSFPVMKNTNAILALTEREAYIERESACIRCAACVYNCPMGLAPVTLAAAAERGDTAALVRGGVANCMECGSCTFVCPAKRNVLQRIRLGKTLARGKK